MGKRTAHLHIQQKRAAGAASSSFRRSTMKFQIVHESSGRMRIHCAQKRMRLEQADLLEAYLQQTGGVRQAVVHERTCCAVIHYQCAREELLQRISRFAYDAEGVAELAPLHSSRGAQPHL